MNLAPVKQTQSYLVQLTYIGTSFAGFQSQKDGSGIADYLKKVLVQITGDPSLKLIGASRTDAGVHAKEQFCLVKVATHLDSQKLKRGMEALLPKTIGVRHVQMVDDPHFHPIKDALYKQYRYQIWQGGYRDPFFEPFVWNMRDTLDVEGMKRAARLLVGKHNFQSFASSGSSVKTFERRIRKLTIEWRTDVPILEFVVEGDGFLKQMVRNIVGTLVEVGKGKRSWQDLQRILAAQDRRQAGFTAPASGLCLERIFYEEPA